MKNKALASQSLWNRAVSYDEKPVEWQVAEEVSLNPFGTGQCLTTASKLMDIQDLYVSIPLEQGSVLRRNIGGKYGRVTASQSLWNRAVSYDILKFKS